MNICHIKCLPEKTKACCTKTKVTNLIQTASCAKAEIELYEMQPSGYSPLHSHKMQHTILVLEGDGTVFDGEKALPLHPDDVVSIGANEKHQLKTLGKKPFRFLCVTTHVKE